MKQKADCIPNGIAFLTESDEDGKLETNISLCVLKNTSILILLLLKTLFQYFVHNTILFSVLKIITLNCLVHTQL